MQRQELISRYKEIRQTTEEICKPLEIEDYVPQPISDVSPPRWHLAHTTWFFETFLLQKFQEHYTPFHPLYNYIFNSYYHSLGKRWEREKRGCLTRPTVKEVYKYRNAINSKMQQLIEQVAEDKWEDLKNICILGLQHEQQHQELLITDLKLILVNNPLRPVYNKNHNPNLTTDALKKGAEFESFEGGIFEMGYLGNGFAFDNEQPLHKVFVNPFKMGRYLTTNAEYLDFILDGGYRNFRYWLDDGWTLLNSKGWEAPMYWEQIEGVWHEMTLNGLQKLVLDAPVTHVSFYEASAYANWKNKRLPTETEWEFVAKKTNPDPSKSNFFNKKNFHPVPFHEINQKESVNQLLGDVWEWTNSAYLPYPGYKFTEGALGEYNGKFMVNQMVLRGGSCATPEDHIRNTYRNFFQPDKRWQFSGIRLAESI